MYYEEYDVVSESQVRDTLAEIPFDLINESISYQIDDPINSRTDFLGTILDKMDIYLEERDELDPDILAAINEGLFEFLTGVIAKIDEKFDIGIDPEYITTVDTARDIAEVLYEFFILNYVENLSFYIFSYIEKYKSSLANTFNDPDRTDVSITAMKKYISDKDDIIIASNLPSIMKYILDVDIDSIEFLSLASGDGEYAPARLQELYHMGRMIGGFVPKYLSMCLDNRNYIYDEIQTEVRGYILNAFGNKNDDEEE